MTAVEMLLQIIYYMESSYSELTKREKMKLCEFIREIPIKDNNERYSVVINKGDLFFKSKDSGKSYFVNSIELDEEYIDGGKLNLYDILLEIDDFEVFDVIFDFLNTIETLF